MKAYLLSAKRGANNAANGTEQKPKNEVINKVQSGGNVVGRAGLVGINRGVLRVLDVDGNAADSGSGSHPFEGDIALRHGERHADRRRAGHGDFVTNGAVRVHHLNPTAVPSLEVGGLADDFPSAGRTILVSCLGKFTLDAVRFIIHRVGVAVIVGDLVLEGHGLSWGDVVLREDLGGTTHQHHLLDVLDGFASHVHGRIGPRNDTRLGVCVDNIDM